MADTDGDNVKRARTALIGHQLAASLLLAGCAAGPDFVRPSAPPDKDYLATGPPAATIAAHGTSQQFVWGTPVSPTWWTLFGSTALNDIMRAALGNNPSLQSAQSSLRASREDLQAGYGVFFPQIDFGLSGVRQRVAPVRGVGVLPGIFNVFTLGATVSYLLDLAGGSRRNVERLAAQADYQGYQVSATWLTLSGNIVNTFIARAGYAAQIEATRALLSLLAQQRAIAKVQAAAGTAPYANILAIETRMASSEASLPLLEQRYQQANHLLATLAGSTPAAWRAPDIALEHLSLPRKLPLSLPSELVRQRPDILSAEAVLHVASAGVGVATAALFPSFRLDGTFGNVASVLHDTTSARGRFWSGSADLTQPLFHGGTLIHQRRAAVEAYSGALADYRATVLAAFAQVADALTALGNDARALEAQVRAVDVARQSVAILQANYAAGLVSYLDVLVADEQLYQARINYVQALAQRFQDTAALYLALGGGWWDLQGDLKTGGAGGRP